MAIPMANINEIKEINPASIKNCRTSSALLEPNVFRMPTSLALFREWAVDKFIKLTLAKRIKNKPIKERI